MQAELFAPPQGIVTPFPLQAGPRPQLEQFFTPEWSAVRLIEEFFPYLGRDDFVVEPSCGPGSFLKAIPEHVPAMGVEVDADLAALARDNTGREVVCGDFRTVALPRNPTAIVGNPPWNVADVKAFLARAHRLLPESGACGFILPAHRLSYSGPVLEWAKQWSIQQTMLPKSLFPRLSWPIVFAQFRKERVRTTVGFFLFEEAEAVKSAPKNVRLVLVNGKKRVGLWRAVVETAMRDLGRPAFPHEICAAVEGRKPRPIPTWRDTVRRTLQEGPFVRSQDGRWALAA